MESIYGPPPGARQPQRGRKHSEPRPVPRWKQALGTTAAVLGGVGLFVILVALEEGDSDIEDSIRNLQRIQWNLPRHDPIVFDMPAFKPLQSAEIIPRSAIHPAGHPAEASATPRRLQTAGIISR